MQAQVPPARNLDGTPPRYEYSVVTKPQVSGLQDSEGGPSVKPSGRTNAKIYDSQSRVAMKVPLAGSAPVAAADTA